MIKYTQAEIQSMQHSIGHNIPRPYSQTLAEDLTVMPESAKERGDGIKLMEMARQVHEAD